MIRIGIIGCGKIAQVRHLPEYAANPHVELAGYYDLNTQRAQEMAAQYGGKVYDSYFDLLNDPSIDAVSICVENRSHAEITTYALYAGKHVLCEKPMAVTLAECESMVAAAERNGKHLMIGHNMRFDPVHRKAKELLDAGIIGDIITFHSSDDALEGSLNTHRIVAVEDAADGTPVYRTKGDANPVEDAAPVPAADVVGRVVFVSAGLGVVVSLLTNPLLFFPLIVVPLIVLLVLEIRHMVKTTQEVARAEDEAALRAAVEQIREKRRREQEEQGDAGDEGDADGGHTDESAEADPGAPGDSNRSA